MKYSELARKLNKMGWRFLRQGGKHEIWTDGFETVAVPRHKEIKEATARNILKDAAINKGGNN